VNARLRFAALCNEVPIFMANRLQGAPADLSSTSMSSRGNDSGSTRLLTLAALAALSGAACIPAAQAGMADQPRRPSPDDALVDEVARVEPRGADRALLVVYPKTACSGSARMVVLDDSGNFYGAIGPGEAALLEIPKARREIIVVSNVEITSAPRTWFYADRLDVPAEPNGLVLEAMRRNTRTCMSGQYAHVTVATKEELESTLANAVDIRWRTPRRAEGQAWIDEHRERVDELVDRPRVARVR